MAKKISIFHCGPKKEMGFNFPAGSTILGVEAITKDRIGFFFLHDVPVKANEMRTFIMRPIGAIIQSPELLSPPYIVYIPCEGEYRLFFEKLPDASQRGWLEKPRL